jgi:hypothetical protein
MEKIFANAQDVMDSVCPDCGGVPQADWLPFWTYDEFAPCTCPVTVPTYEQRMSLQAWIAGNR